MGTEISTNVIKNLAVTAEKIASGAPDTKITGAAITGQTAATPASGDSIMLSDADDSGSLKKATFGDLVGIFQKPWSAWSEVDLTNGGANDQTTVELLASLSGVSEIELYCEGLSTDAATNALLQLSETGTGYITTGYAGFGAFNASGQNNTANTTGFRVGNNGAAADAIYGTIRLSHLGSNKWAVDAILSDDGGTMIMQGTLALAAALDAVRMTTVSGTANFDGGAAIHARYR